MHLWIWIQNTIKINITTKKIFFVFNYIVFLNLIIPCSAGKLNQKSLCQTTFELAGQIVAECVGNSNGNLNRRSIFPLKSLRVHLSLAQCTFFLNSPFKYQSMLISAACPLCKREYHFHKEINKNFPQPQSQNQLQWHHKKWQNKNSMLLNNLIWSP